MTRAFRLPSRALRPVAVFVATFAVSASCGSSGTPSVKQADLEKEISTQLQKQVGQAPDDISCPGDLKGEKGTTMRCTLTAGTDKLGLTVTVTSVDGDDVKFDIQVDQMDGGSSSNPTATASEAG